MTTAIIYHKSDLDGVGSAAIVLGLHPKAELYPADYDDEDYEVSDFEGKDVFIVDFCPKEIEKINEVCRGFRWIDHHKSAMEKHPKLWKSKDCMGKRDIKHSAIYLTYIYCYGANVPQAVQYIEDYDMWWFRHGRTTRAFCEYAFMQLKTPDDTNWSCLLANNRDMIDDWYHKGEILLEAKQDRIDKTVKHITAKQWGLNKVGIVNTNHDISNVGNAIATNGYDIGVVWSHSDGRVTVSLRSTKVDVSTIAKCYGGGGHKLAAGCTIDFHTLLEWLA